MGRSIFILEVYSLKLDGLVYYNYSKAMVVLETVLEKILEMGSSHGHKILFFLNKFHILVHAVDTN